MQKHTKIYLKAFRYDISDFIPSEISGNKAVDIHHIIGRGKGGEDRIENLMALTRGEHIKRGDKKEFMIILFDIHEEKLISNNIPYDTDYMDNLRRKYEN